VSSADRVTCIAIPNSALRFIGGMMLKSSGAIARQKVAGKNHELIA